MANIDDVGVNDVRMNLTQGGMSTNTAFSVGVQCRRNMHMHGIEYSTLPLAD